MAGKCPESNAKGEPCGATKLLKELDPDGVRRCYRHSEHPDRIAQREEADARSRKGGIEGKARELAHRKSEAKERAAGTGPKVPKRRGKRGPTPNATPVPKADAPPVSAQLEQAPKTAQILEPESLEAAFGGFDLETADGRLEYRRQVVLMKLRGDIDARDAEVLARLAADQSKDKRPQRGNRTVQVRWVDIDSQQDADGLREAQEFAEGLQ